MNPQPAQTHANRSTREGPSCAFSPWSVCPLRDLFLVSSGRSFSREYACPCVPVGHRAGCTLLGRSRVPSHVGMGCFVCFVRSRKRAYGRGYRLSPRLCILRMRAPVCRSVTVLGARCPVGHTCPRMCVWVGMRAPVRRSVTVLLRTTRVVHQPQLFH